LQRGNPELEETVYGKTYLLAGEKEQAEFVEQPAKFLVASNPNLSLPLPPPPPKVMVVGMKGSGVTTQIQKLCRKYKLEELGLKEKFLEQLAAEKEVRKRRRGLDRGFKPPPPLEEGEEP
jgi:hypothetical protein